MSDTPTQSESRRSFLKQSSTVLAGATLASISTAANAAGSDLIKIALIGCGGRGGGAVDQIMRTKGNVKLVAVADAFEEKCLKVIKRLDRAHKGKVDVPQERIFSGLDAYKKAIDAGVDLVVIATPPGFKPQQFEYAVNKSKHIFAEKPLASDAPGVKRVLAANEKAKEKNLMVAIGLQRRHEPRYLDNVKRLQDGAIGDINLLRVYWNGGGIWYRDRSSKQPTEMAFQCNNWYHFIWTCGDQICEQHIHNLDVGCWVKGMYPVKANGMGGSQERMGGNPAKSQIFDHTFVEYTFPDGTKMYSQGRHLGGKGVYKPVNEYAHGSKGVSKIGFEIEPFGGSKIRMSGANGHQQEQTDMINALMRGETYNEGDYGAKSTFTAILGREACYSGRELKWDELLAKGKDYCPGIDSYSMESAPPAMKNSNGIYDVPRPGKYDPYKAL